MPALVTGVDGGVTIRVRVGRLDRHDRPRRLRVDEAEGRRTLVARGRSRRSPTSASSTPNGDVHGDARAAARRSKARCSRSTTTPARCWRWSAASSFEREPVQPRDAGAAPGRIALQAVRVHGRDRSRLHGARRCSTTRRSSFTAGPGQPPYEPKNYDREYRRADHAARARSKQSRNVPTIRLMAALDPQERHPLRAQARHHVAAPAVSLGRDRRGRRHAARDDVGLLGVPQSGRAHDAAMVLEVIDRDGNVLEQHRAEPHEAIRADTAYIMTNLLRRRRPARHRRGAPTRSTGRSAARPARPTTTPTPGSSASIRTSRSASGSASIRRSRSATEPTGTLAALPIWTDDHEDLGRARRDRAAEPPTFDRPGNIVIVMTARDRKRSSPAPSRMRQLAIAQGIGNRIERHSDRSSASEHSTAGRLAMAS